MKVARSKEAASLPKPSAQAAKRPPADPLDLEAGSSGRDPLESAALLQVGFGPCTDRLRLEGQVQHNDGRGRQCADTCCMHPDHGFYCWDVQKQCQIVAHLHCGLCKVKTGDLTQADSIKLLCKQLRMR